MTNEIIPPWYKQFWPWFLISIPLTSVILSFIMVTKAVNQPHTMVTDSYYKEGLEINQDLSLDKMAKELGVSALVRSQADGTSVIVTLTPGKAYIPDYLILNLEHPTLQDQDAQVQLQRNGDVYSITVGEAIKGRRYITLTPDTNNWRLKGEMFFPSDTGYQLTPTVY